VQLFHRNILVQAFKLPLWGQVADEIPPAWLVRRLQSGELTINRLGGVTMNTQWGVQSCAAGDILLLTEDDQIQFVTPDEFEKLVPVEELQKAA
jgi:hypothetical protein